MANNRSSDSKKYPAPFSLRLNSDEREELKRLADGIPMGQFIKDAIFNKKVRPNYRRSRPAIRDHKLLAQILGMLGKSRIPSNINQLAKAANSGSLPVNEEVLKSLFEAVRAIEWMRKSLIEGMGLKAQGSAKPKNDQHDS